MNATCSSRSALPRLRFIIPSRLRLPCCWSTLLLVHRVQYSTLPYCTFRVDAGLPSTALTQAYSVLHGTLQFLFSFHGFLFFRRLALLARQPASRVLIRRPSLSSNLWLRPCSPRTLSMPACQAFIPLRLFCLLPPTLLSTTLSTFSTACGGSASGNDAARAGFIDFSVTTVSFSRHAPAAGTASGSATTHAVLPCTALDSIKNHYRVAAGYMYTHQLDTKRHSILQAISLRRLYLSRLFSSYNLPCFFIDSRQSCAPLLLRFCHHRHWLPTLTCRTPSGQSGLLKSSRLSVCTVLGRIAQTDEILRSSSGPGSTDFTSRLRTVHCLNHPTLLKDPCLAPPSSGPVLLDISASL